MSFSARSRWRGVFEGCWRRALHRAWPFGALVVVLGFAWAPLFAGAVSFTRDPANWNYPARAFVREALRRGESPFWNPLQGFGLSTAANPLYGIFYPPNWAFLAVSSDHVIHMLTWQSFVHMAWGGAGVLALARSLGCGRTPALTGALAWSLSGCVTSAWTAGLLLLADAWVPWVALGFVALLRAAARPGASPSSLAAPTARAALPVAMALLMGELFVALMGIGFAVLLAVVEGSTDRVRAPVVVRVALAASVAIAVGASTAGATLVPVRAAVAGNDRGQAMPLDVAERCSTHPLRLLELAAPEAFGYPGGTYAAGAWVGEPTLGNRPLLLSVYGGAAALALAVLSLSRRNRRSIGLALIACAGWLVAMGRHTPVHRVVRALLPPLAHMRYPEKYLIVSMTAFALLVALGTDRLLRWTTSPEARRALVRAWIVVGGLIATMVVALASMRTFAAPALTNALPAATLRGALALGGVALAAALIVAAKRPRAGTALLLAIVVVDLASAARPFQELSDASFATVEPPATRWVRARNPDAPAPARVYRRNEVDAELSRRQPVPSLEVAQLQSMQTLVYANNVFGLAIVPAYDAAAASASRALWKAARTFGASALRLMAVPLALMPASGPNAATANDRRGLEPIREILPGAGLHRVLHALPRVYLASRAELLSHEPDVAALVAPDVVSGRAVILDAREVGDRAVLLPGDADAEPAGTCELISFVNARVVARCRGARPAFAVFVEQHDPGWTARVDGAPAPLWRANGVFRAVPVPSGDHVVELAFAPAGLRTGVTLSLTGLLAIVALAAVGAIRRSSRDGASPTAARS